MTESILMVQTRANSSGFETWTRIAREGKGRGRSSTSFYEGVCREYRGNVVGTFRYRSSLRTIGSGSVPSFPSLRDLLIQITLSLSLWLSGSYFLSLSRERKREGKFCDRENGINDHGITPYLQILFW